MGVRAWVPTVVAWALASTAALLQINAAKEKDARPPDVRYGSLLTSTAAIAVSAFIVGPYVLTPALLVANTAAWAQQPHARTRGRVGTIVIGCLGLAVPVALQLVGVAPQSYAFEGGRMDILPVMNALPAVATQVTLFTTSVALIVTLSVFVSRVRDALTEAQAKLQMQAWQLRQLVPEHGPT
jgi:hypothetical protein